MDELLNELEELMGDGLITSYSLSRIGTANTNVMLHAGNPDKVVGSFTEDNPNTITVKLQGWRECYKRF